MKQRPESAKDSSLDRTDIYLALGSGFLALIAYLVCLCPTVGPGDSGELTLAALKLGICHPPGYPLFTWLGRLACLLPLREPAVATNALTALLSAAAVSFVFLAARSLSLSRLGSAVAALVFGFSATFWENSSSHEVYSFTILLLAALIFLARRARFRPNRLLPLAGFVYGLALAHQPGALLWLPALVVLFGKPEGIRPFQTIPGLGLFFLLGLSSGLGTLILATANPAVNWGDPSALGRFIAHATASDYQDLSLVSSLLLSRTAGLPAIVSAEFGIPAALFAVTGLVFLALRSGRILLGLGLLLATAVFGLGFNVHDFRVQLLPSFLALSLLAGTGVHWVEGRLPRFRAAALIMLALPVFTLVFNMRTSRDSRTTLVRDLGTNLLASVPSSAALIFGHDVEGNAMRYVQTVTGFQTEVFTISAEMLFDRPYWTALGRRVRLPDRDRLLSRALKKIGRLKGQTQREVLKQHLLEPLIRELLRNHPVYLSVGTLTQQLLSGPATEGYDIVPVGIVNRIEPAAEPPDKAGLLAENRKLWHCYLLDAARREHRSPHLTTTQSYYPSSRNNFGMFCLEQGWHKEALENLDAALELPAPEELRQVIRQNRARALSR